MSSDAYQIRAEKVLIADNHDASSGARASKRVVPSSAMAPSGKAMLSSADMVDGQQALVGGGCRGRRQVMAEVQVGAWVWWSGAALHSAFCRWRQRGSCAVDRWAAGARRPRRPRRPRGRRAPDWLRYGCQSTHGHTGTGKLGEPSAAAAGGGGLRGRAQPLTDTGDQRRLGTAAALYSRGAAHSAR